MNRTITKPQPKTTQGPAFVSLALMEYETIKRAERAIERKHQELSRNMRLIRPEDMGEYVRISTRLENGERPVFPGSSASEALRSFQAIVRAEERKEKAWASLRQWLAVIPANEMDAYVTGTQELDEMFDEEEADE